MKKPETQFREKVRGKLEQIPNTWWESIQQKSILGTPDIVGCVSGFFVALELKASEGKPSKLQELKLHQIAEAGGMAILLYPENWDEVYELLKYLSKGRK